MVFLDICNEVVEVEDEENPPRRLAFSNTDRSRFRRPIRSVLGRNPACVIMDEDGEDDPVEDDDEEDDRVKS